MKTEEVKMYISNRPSNIKENNQQVVSELTTEVKPDYIDTQSNQIDKEVNEALVEEEQLKRSKTPRCTGVYILGNLYNKPVWFTIDTGASRTIVSWRVFQQLPRDKCTLNCDGKGVTMEQANGTSLDVKGTAV